MESKKITVLQKPKIGNEISQFISVYTSAPHFCHGPFLSAVAKQLRVDPAVPWNNSDGFIGKLIFGFVLKFVHALQFWLKSATNSRLFS
jgi:hypothetical protein